jgi:hypothetical protein
VARRIAREAAALRGALEAELWGSALLGVLWNRRFDLSRRRSGAVWWWARRGSQNRAPGSTWVFAVST